MIERIFILIAAQMLLLHATAYSAEPQAAQGKLTEAMAVEWAKFHINVNAIAPGTFASEMVGAMVERIGDFSQYFPRQRICDPAQMDSTLLFLASPSSDCVTGAVIKVDDGQLRR